MTIRDQFRILIFGVVAVPILCLIAMPVNHYFSRPDRALLSGYKQVRKLEAVPLSERDLGVLLQAVKTLPSHVEFMVVANHTEILYSTIPEFKGQKSIEEKTLFTFMNESSHQYFYQMVSPPIENKNIELVLISRVSRDGNIQRLKSFDGVFFSIFAFIIIFELFCIAVIFVISRTISKSITVLESNTQKIANGELEEPLDISKTQKSSNEIIRLTENLEKMRLALKDNEERRSKFIMGISHDLRTPVAIIKGYAEALADGLYEEPEDIKKTLKIILTKSEQLETMINTLLNFVKLNQTEWQQHLTKQKLEPFLVEFAETSLQTSELLKRKIETNISVSPDLEIPFDKMLTQRALENLFSNALRYTVDNDTISIIATQSEDSVEIKIADTGIGIDQKDIDRIFDMFYRATNSRQESGMGIGLSVVKTIVNTHGWKIRVESEKGVGTAFIITIPLHDTFEKSI